MARIIAVSIVAAIVFMNFYPVTNSWSALIAEGCIALVCLTVGYFVFSSTIRTIAVEEIGTTLRLFRPS